MLPSFFFGPHARLLGMTILWGASWPAGRIVAQAMPPLAAASLRFVLALLVLLPWMYHSGGFAQLKNWSTKRWLGMALGGFIGVFGYASLFLSGLQYLPAGKAALLITLNPVVTLLLAVWLFKERLNAIIGLGMAMAFCGAIIVISQGNPLHILRGQLGLGEWLILGCVACWVGYTLLGRWVMNGVDALSATAVTASFGALFLIVASLLVEGTAGVQAALHSGWSAWGALLFLAFGATALAYAWFFDGVKVLGAGAAAGYITLVPGVAWRCWARASCSAGGASGLPAHHGYCPYGTKLLSSASTRRALPVNGKARCGQALRSHTLQPMPMGVAASRLRKSKPLE